MRPILAIAIVLSCVPVYGQECFNSSVVAPSPLMGNHGEIFRTSDGAIYQVTGSYEYLYAYYPSVTICPSRERMLVEGRTVGILPIQPSGRSEEPSGKKSPNKPRQREASPSEAPITIVYEYKAAAISSPMVPVAFTFSSGMGATTQIMAMVSLATLAATALRMSSIQEDKTEEFTSTTTFWVRIGPWKS